MGILTVAKESGTRFLECSPGLGLYENRDDFRVVLANSFFELHHSRLDLRGAKIVGEFEAQCDEDLIRGEVDGEDIVSAIGFAAYFSEVIVGNIGNRLVAQTQKRIFDHMLNVDIAFFQAYSSSDLVTRMSYNANNVRDVLSLVSLNVGRDLFTIVGLVCTMVVLDPVLSAIALIGGPIAALSSRKMVARIKKATKGEIHSLSGIIQITREVSQGAQVVKSFQLENKMRVRMFNAIDSVQRLANKMLKIQAGVNPLMEAIGGCAVAAVIFYAGWQNLYHGASPGQFFAFITALLMCSDPARRLSRVQLQLATATMGVSMMFELLDAPEREAEEPGRPELKVSGGGITPSRRFL